MSMINVSNLTFGYDGSYDNIFENVSFRIDTGWRLGFTGRNGRGKTTFLNLLLGKYEYSGSITASVDFEYFPYEVRDMSALTREVLDGIDGSVEDWRLMRELARLEVGEDALWRPFGTLSNGERTKVLLAALFLRENSFLLIDEPTNHLDAEARTLIADYLRSKEGFILVSHDRAFLDGCIDHILSINRADIEIQSGNFSSWYRNRQLQDNYELEQDARLKKDIRRLRETAREKAEWSDRAERRKIGIDPKKVDNKKGYMPKQAAKAKKTMRRVGAIEGRIERELAEKERLLKNIEKAETLKLHPLEFHSRRLVEFSGAMLAYGTKTVCKDVSFTIEQGDRVALCGRNGCGKSSVIKRIIGEGGIDCEGDIFVAKGLRISYVGQDASELSGSLEEYERSCGVDPSLFRTILRKLDFARVQFEKDIGDYSAGQKKKVLLARSLCEKAHLYIWDEPLNYIDVLSRMQIESLIKEYNPTLLFVEHDRAFCDAIATKRVQL